MSHLLFITRKYPPSVGGMQLYARRLEEQFAAHHPTDTIALGGSQLNLVWFIPWALLRGLLTVFSKPITHVHIGDVLLAPLGVLFRLLTNARTSVTAFGLDVVFPPFWYQRMVEWALPKLDVVIAISHSTQEECLRRGVPEQRCHVVYCGTDLQENLSADVRAEARTELRGILSGKLDGNPLVVALGRHVKRKGFRWLVTQVVPRLPDSATVIIAGDGPERPTLGAAVESGNLGKKLRLLGRVSHRVKKLLFQAADVFAMPNRRIPGDIEGFGLVAIEASSYGTPVVACGIEGITDAVIDGLTGCLVPELDAPAFAASLLEVSTWNRKRVKRATEKRYSWDRVYREYAAVLHLG